jgi:hypothetical protein
MLEHSTSVPERPGHYELEQSAAMNLNNRMRRSKQFDNDTHGVQPVSTISALALIVAVVLLITFITAGMCGSIFSCQ